jgi:hypothetical protein
VGGFSGVFWAVSGGIRWKTLKTEISMENGAFQEVDRA